MDAKHLLSRHAFGPKLIERPLEDDPDPARWARMMRASIRMGVERFSSDRMVTEYFARLYSAAS